MKFFMWIIPHICSSLNSICQNLERNVLRPIGVIGGGLAILVALVGSVAFLLVLLRYLSIRLIPSGQGNTKEVPMEKTLTASTRIYFSSVFETIWAIGVGSVVGHLST